MATESLLNQQLSTSRYIGNIFLKDLSIALKFTYPDLSLLFEPKECQY